MTRPKAALIDLDGTLVDSAPELAAAVNRMRVDFDLPPVDEACVRTWVGAGIDTLVGHALEDAPEPIQSKQQLRAARVAFDAAYAEVLGTMAPLYPGVLQGLDRLRSASVATACITNKARIFAVPFLGALGLTDRFDMIVADDSGAAGKPNAAPLLKAAERLGVSIECCIVIGDSFIDIAAARNAGCPVWCVRTGYNRDEPIEAANPDAVFDRFDGLVEALVHMRP